MSHPYDHKTVRIQFYATAPYPCSYLDDHQARSQVAIPSELIDGFVYSQLVRNGFRRSGLFTYRPYCDNCRACVPVRLPVRDFTPSRTQRRIWRRQEGLSVTLEPLRFDEAHYEMYRRYQESRHAGGGMDEDSREQYENFILKSNVDSFLAVFHDNGQLRMVSLIDRLTDGLSSVYTFFDPDYPQASYGVYNVLWQINHAKALGLSHLYLGYWIEACRKMSYKTQYRPIEVLTEQGWRRLADAA
ncbi:arginyltransferase [Parachitinimonas caeni]|uniref:Aspartate/glutamate leucyltransferase n=1 Tax=Parachitinimonas caeni TaxID=3031301 RepID=A0ABT7DUB8_9NEIS|nr:arginyltransferase [Parachitinimonas caeni]MDK2123679.1 arginyltransferase [Parachitinimonas caeni]